MIAFCQKYKLPTAAMHLCVNTLGDVGPVVALQLLKDFYEQSQDSYTGLKLIWAAQNFIQGNKFPKGKLKNQQQICHQTLHLITQPHWIETLCEINTEAYFQLISLPFNTSLL